jgi:hypothetical protein
MDLTALAFQLVGGAVAGYATGYFSKTTDLGPVGNATVGALGGGIGGQLLFGLLGLGGSVQVISALLTGAIGGGLVTLLVGLLKSKVSP